MSEENGSITTTQAAPLATASARPKLALALSKAQQAVRRVGHDARNDFHRYDYTSAEAIIEAAKDPLAAAELALVPLEETLNGFDREGPDRYELICRFILLHSSGESLPLVRHWPVCPDKGRPLDKATAAASTLALAYLLRDLLLMPRVAQADDVTAREERPAAPAGKPAAKAGKKKSALPKDGAELEQRLKSREAKLVAEGLCKPGDLLTAVTTAGVKAGYVKELVRWPAAAMQLAADETTAFVAKCKAGNGPIHAGSKEG